MLMESTFVAIGCGCGYIDIEEWSLMKPAHGLAQQKHQ